MADGGSQPDLAAVLQLLSSQIASANQRDQQFQTLMQQLQSSDAATSHGPSSSGHSSGPAGSAPKPVSAERPVLISSATMSDFATFEEAWADYAQCQHLSSQDRETRMSAFRQCLDEDLRRYVREQIIVFPAGADVADAMPVLRAYIRRQRNPLLDRIDFYGRRQQRGEAFDSFYTSLRELFHACDFSACSVCSTCDSALCSPCKQSLQKFHADILRDRVVTGIYEEATRHKLLATPDLTLEGAITVCRAEEAASNTSSSIPSASSGSVQAISSKTTRKPAPTSRNSGDQKSRTSHAPSKPSPDKCPYCGRTPHTKNPCPAASRKCNGCQRMGHFKEMCPRNQKSSSSPTGKVGQLRLQRASLRNGLTMSVNTHLCTDPAAVPFDWVPDTGSDVDAIGRSHLAALGGYTENLATDPDIVSAANGVSLSNLGKIDATLSVADRHHTTTIHVYEDLDEPLLSHNSLRALGLLPASWPRVSQLKSSPSQTEIEQTKAQLMSEFSDVFDDSKLHPMSGPPMEIKLQSDATPRCVNGSRPIPFAYRDQVKSQLDDMVDNGIIEPVTEPSEWCHPVVLVDKKSSSEKRLTVDLRSLNQQVARPVHPARTPRDAVTSIGKAAFFTTIDARHGYWQVPLSESSKPLTTFITPWGRYRFCRNPQGFTSAGDEFNSRTDAAFDRLTNFVKVVDDGLVHDVSFADHVTHVRDVLVRAREHGITLNPVKFNFAASEVEYCGYVLNADGYHVDDRKISAIRDFKLPQSRTDLRSFLGLANQCTDFTPQIAALSESLRPLLKTSNEFLWQPNHTEAFNALKCALSESPVLSFFQFGMPLRLETDASVKNGLGFALWQQQDQQWHLIQCGSRFLSDAETRYAVIELECLAVVWAVRKCHLYLAGASFDVVTDHRPLVPIINHYSLDQIENPRLLRLLLKLRPYQICASWQKGSAHLFADALSRHPVDMPTTDDELGEHPVLSCRSVRACLHHDSPKSIPFATLLSAAKSDPDYQQLIKYLQSGFPSKQQQLPESLRPYWNGREQLSVDSGLIMRGPRIVIPVSLRSSTLEDLHAAHQGLTRTKRRARQTVYWPGINAELDALVRDCPECREFLPSQPSEPLMSDRKPTLPFESVSADLFSCQGSEFLVYVDRLTGWPCVAKLGHSTKSIDVIREFRRWFPDLGVPRELSTDGGPQFSSHRFADFCKRWQISHVTSSPHFPQSNGHAEAAVKAVKYLIAKTCSNGNLDTDAFQRGLLEWRNTPSSSGFSPAQLLFGRSLSSFVFAHTSQFAPEWQQAADARDADTMPSASDPSQSSPPLRRELRKLAIGTHVDLQLPTTKRWSARGIIVGIGAHRDYHVKLASGRILWRNRRYLRPHRPLTPAAAAPAAADLHHVEATDLLPAASPCPDVSLQPVRRSGRSRRQNVPFNIISTHGCSYD